MSGHGEIQKLKKVCCIIPAGYIQEKLYAANFVNNQAQVESISLSRSSPAYTTSKNGSIQGVSTSTPQINYDISVKGSVQPDPAILLEEQAKNSIRNDANGTNGLYCANGTLTPTANPQGTNDQAYIVKSGATNNYLSNATGAQINIGQRIQFSFYCRRISTRYIHLTIINTQPQGPADATFDMELSKPVALTTAVQSVEMHRLPNGWFRCVLTTENWAGPGQIIFQMNGTNTLATPTFTPINSEFIVWGLQAENSDTVTNYIRNTTQGGVTRQPGSMFVGPFAAANPVNAYSGILYIEFKGVGQTRDGNHDIILGSTSNPNGYYRMRWQSSGGMIFQLNIGGINSIYRTIASFDQTKYNKIACNWAENYFEIWINGEKQGTTDTTGAVPSFKNAFSQLQIGASKAPYGYYREISIYDTGNLANVYDVSAIMENLTK
tara:strand:- start:14066 stop:15376 length:1311 start_codon:yes stop_codon:yes gene_type:complete